MIRTRVFRSNRTQAVRLPKAVALPDQVQEVEITIVGNSRVITPADHTWTEFFASPERATPDFLADRDQPAPQERSS